MHSKLRLASLGLLIPCLTAALAQEPVTLAERFDPAEAYRVELKVRLSGRLAIPQPGGKPADVATISGTSTLVYDERPLPADDARTAKTVRVYRDVEIARTIADRDQKADLRPDVRRMIVLRTDAGKKAPFSPDGPLTWGEIDVVRADLFCPALVPGLLPTKPVRLGDRWPVAAPAVTDLTDLDPIEEGGLTAEFIAVINLSGKRYAKLTVVGIVKGASEDGPSRQHLDGIAYFDLEAKRLSYLNLKGTRELLGPDGKATAGKIDGTFVMTRTAAGRTNDLSDGALRGLDLSPTADNSELLYDNPELGIRFRYPRRWRVGAVQGKQVTVEEAHGGGILMTVIPTNSTPTADQYLAETKAYLEKNNWAILSSEPIRRVSDRPRVDRFAFDAEVGKDKVRMEYAVISSIDGGATIAARIPATDRADLEKDVERILRTVAVLKK